MDIDVVVMYLCLSECIYRSDFSYLHRCKVKKQQKTKRKADTVDMSTGIVDIKFHDREEIQTTLTTGIGLRDRKASKKDLIVDPANRKEIGEAIESGSTLTDEATDFCTNNVTTIVHGSADTYNVKGVYNKRIPMAKGDFSKFY